MGTAILNALNLYNERCKEVGKNILQITEFREKLVTGLLLGGNEPLSAADHRNVQKVSLVGRRTSI